MKKSVPILVAITFTFFFQACMSTDNNAQSPKKYKGQEAQANYVGIDPSTLYTKLPDTAELVVDSSKIKASEPTNTKIASPHAGLSKVSTSTVTVKLCTDINLGGTCATLDIDEGDGNGLDYNDLRYNNPWGNDNISSAAVTGGGSVYLCRDNNWGGPCYLVDRPIYDFRSFPQNGSYFNFNDQTSSIKFHAVSDGKITMDLYDQAFGGGQVCRIVSPFDYNIMPCGLNDKVSSLYLYKNFVSCGSSPENQVQFYKDAGFGGPSFIADGGNPLLNGGWNDVISSFKWVAPYSCY